MNKFTVVYTVSDKGNMIRDILKSLKSLHRYISVKNVLIFYTRPRSSYTRERMLKYGNVKYSLPISKPFEFRKGVPGFYGGEKIHLCMCNTPSVIFLDCDTVVNTTFKKYLDMDADFIARVGTGKANDKEWKKLFGIYGKKEVYPMFNAGFLVFNNYSYRKICKEWLAYSNDDTMLNPFPNTFPKEQIALSLALSGNISMKKIGFMSSKMHSFAWNGDSTKCDVYHKGNFKLWQRVGKRIKRRYFDESK